VRASSTASLPRLDLAPTNFETNASSFSIGERARKPGCDGDADASVVDKALGVVASAQALEGAHGGRAGSIDGS
jgi:hypothetical protein